MIYETAKVDIFFEIQTISYKNIFCILHFILKNLSIFVILFSIL